MSSALDVQLSTTAAGPTEVTDRDRRRLVEVLAVVPDPRRRRGVCHRFTPLLAATVCAMLAGARSFAAISEWVADLSQSARDELGLSGVVPAGSTLWRLLTAVDPTALQDALGVWLRARLPRANRSTRRRLRGRRVLAVDGKAMRATVRAAARIHLLGVLDHASGVVVGQVNVDAKTNEITCFTTVLEQVGDLRDTVITMDALHCQTAHAQWLHEQGAHMIVCVKGNQPGLLKQLQALPWKQVPVGHDSTDQAHGRIERRILKAVTVTDSAGGLGFPHAAQAVQIVRRSRPINPKTATKAKGKKKRQRNETVYAIVTLAADQATPAELASWIRGHWTIENRLHWVRDVTLGEDLHQARTGHGPEVLAILRNLLISLLRLAGHTNIARALRHYSRHTDQAILLVTSPLTTSQ